MLRIALLVACAAVYSAQGQHVLDTPKGTSHGLQTLKVPNPFPDVPHYRGAYRNVTGFIAQYMLYLFPAVVYIPPSNETRNLKLILAVIDGLVNKLAITLSPGTFGIPSYESIYEYHAEKLLKAAQQNPQLVEERLRCVPGDINKSIQPIGDIINQDNIQKICNSAPSACDPAIASMIGSTGLSNTGKLLLALSDYVNLVRGKYWEQLIQLKDLSPKDLLSYVRSSEKFLKPLILHATEIRFMLGGDRCAEYKLQETNKHI